MFGESTGRQCACITLFSIAWSKIRRVGLWNSSDLNYILNEGDQIYKNLGECDFLTVDDLPESVDIKSDCVIVTKLRYIEGEISNAKNIFESHDDSEGFLLFIDSYTLAVLWNKARVFLFDSHSKDAQGKASADGSSILLQFTSFIALNKYIREVYFAEKQVEKLYFAVQYIKINSQFISTSQKRKISNLPRVKEHKKQKREYSAKKYSSVTTTKAHEERKNRCEIFAQREINKLAKNVGKLNKKKDKISEFRKQINEGPYYICVVCNRCLYKRSVKVLSTATEICVVCHQL